ncbi:MAG: DNA cytosine methyltransferase [Planctomycetota bacterium]|nr:DNA cytosine methyltransferase [Planctomycetota bacterium]
MATGVFRAVDLFSGPGGLTLGLKAGGIRPIASVEWNKDAVATYKSHTPDSEHHCGDIRQVDLSRYRGAADIVFGGPPCQPFSTGGLRKGNDDERNMIPPFLAAVETINPAAVLMENVPGMLVKHRRYYFESILKHLVDLGYRPTWRLLNSADYGIPQKRRRVFIVAFKNKDIVFRFPRPTHGTEVGQPHVPASAFVNNEPLGEPARSPVCYAPIIDIRPSPYAGHVYKGGGRPIDMSGPCQTVYASAGGNKTHWVDTMNVAPEYHRHLMRGGKTREGIVPGARRLSVEESALIQTFPPNFRFHGSRSSQFTQVGDAVPPRLAEHLGDAIVAQLAGTKLDDLSYYPPPIACDPLLW